MDNFGISPETVNELGKTMSKKSEEFNQLITNLYTTVDKMVTNFYVSPDAEVLAKRIEAYKNKLIGIRNTIASYGVYCQSTTNIVYDHQDNLSNDLRG